MVDVNVTPDKKTVFLHREVRVVEDSCAVQGQETLHCCFVVVQREGQESTHAPTVPVRSQKSQSSLKEALLGELQKSLTQAGVVLPRGGGVGGG